MKTTARSIISATTGLGLTAFTLFSAFAYGTPAPATVLGFAFLSIYGLLEIAVLSYASPRFELRPASVRPAPAMTSMPKLAGVSAIVEMPASSTSRRAA